MGSNSKEVQTAQLERTEQELAARLATLAERGVEAAKTGKDNVVRHLKADIAQFKRRLATIDKLTALRKELAEKKAAKAAAPRRAKKKKGSAKAEKAAAAQPAGGKKAKKKKAN
jgi:hypothetical protein